MNKLLKLLVSLGLFGNYAVDDDGAGSGDDKDIGDEDIGDEDDKGAGGKEISPGEKHNTDDILKLQQEIKDSKAEIDTLTKDKETRETNTARDAIIAGIKQNHPEFDDSKIVERLKEIHKTDPAKAESLNNSAGWELLHIQEFAPKKVENDFFDLGRNGEYEDRSEEMMKKVEGGEWLSVEDELEVYGKLL